MSGIGNVSAGSAAFTVPVRFPSVSGDPPRTTTPEELLAASHAACYGIGLRSLITRRGGQTRRVTVEATITADKGADGIHIESSHLTAVVEALEGLDGTELEEVAREVADGCTISLALHESIKITHEIKTDGSAAA